jgi:hypothetical protein
MSAAFESIQQTFAEALLDADRPVPGAVTSHTARTPQKRFAVYRNNVVTGLIAALRAQFPACERIVGEEFFAAMARVYIDTEPPRSPILVTYGDGFPAFVASFAPAADIEYLADVARESCRLVPTSRCVSTDYPRDEARRPRRSTTRSQFSPCEASSHHRHANPGGPGRQTKNRCP